MREEIMKDKWTFGIVLEERYRVGKSYIVNEEITIWRMYDNLLRSVVFVLYDKAKRMEELFLIADNLEGTVILAVKQMDGRAVLVFSMEGEEIDSQMIQNWHLSVIQEEETAWEEEAVVEEEQERQNDKVLAVGSLLDHRYRIIKCLGIGGFGITYLCQDIYLHRQVAIKEYFPGQWAEREETYVGVKKSAMLKLFQYGMRSFVQEIAITAKFMYTPHIVTVYDGFLANDTVYMVMKYVKGISIGRELRNRGYKPYSISETIEIIKPVLDALEEIHSRSMVHSDVTPGNVIRSEDGEIVLIDLGSVKDIHESRPMLSTTFFKMEYAAPEQYQTAKYGVAKEEGPWTDIYAIGNTMFYLLTSHKPIDALNRLKRKEQDNIWADVTDIEVPIQWQQFICQAVELDRNRRIQSISQLREKMMEIIEIGGKGI